MKKILTILLALFFISTSSAAVFAKDPQGAAIRPAGGSNTGSSSETASQPAGSTSTDGGNTVAGGYQDAAPVDCNGCAELGDKALQAEIDAEKKAAEITGNDYKPDTKTRIPDPLGGGLCDDLLACNKQSLGSFVGDLKSGIQETYVYREMIPQVIKIILNIAGGLAVLMLVYSGMLFLTAGGDEEQSSKAIKTITFTLIGIAVITLSRVIVAIVENLPLG